MWLHPCLVFLVCHFSSDIPSHIFRDSTHGSRVLWCIPRASTPAKSLRHSLPANSSTIWVNLYWTVVSSANLLVKCLTILSSLISAFYRLVINLHTHSVWETIYDARASRVWHGQIFANFAENTISQLYNRMNASGAIACYPSICHTQLWREINTELIDFYEFVPKNTLHSPRKFKFSQILWLWVLTTQE